MTLDTSAIFRQMYIFMFSGVLLIRRVLSSVCADKCFSGEKLAVSFGEKLSLSYLFLFQCGAKKGSHTDIFI